MAKGRHSAQRVSRRDSQAGSLAGVAAPDIHPHERFLGRVQVQPEHVGPAGLVQAVMLRGEQTGGQDGGNDQGHQDFDQGEAVRRIRASAPTPGIDG